MTNETANISLNKLVAWEGNVRKTGVSDGIGELAASIASHGLLQPLVVRKAARGKYAVVAGQRRLLALQSLVKDDVIERDTPVPCTIIAAGADATEISLAENVVRAPMHPADQFEAFRQVIDNGATVADVAARFGVSESIVEKRLRLGRLSPAVLAAYREGDIGLEQAQAFAVCDDHTAQERVLADLPPWNIQPSLIRRALTEGDIPSTDKRVCFVGLAAYEAAGGAVRRDLFSDEDSSYLLDTALLDRLVSEKLSAAADEIRAEGWRWIETVADAGHDHLSGFGRRYPERRELPEADEAELEKLTTEYDELATRDDDADSERVADIERRMDELNAKAECWTAETLAIAGAVICLDHDGDVRVHRGLVRKEDERKSKQTAKNEGGPAAGSGMTLSAKLVEDLTAHKAAAIGAVLADQPDIALAAVVHALGLGVFYTVPSESVCLQLSAEPAPWRKHIAQPDQCRGITALDQCRERWGERLPGNPGDFLAWCLEQTRDALLELLALIAALSVNTVQCKHDRPDNSRLSHGDALAKATGLCMTSWFRPDAGNYFGRVSRTAIIAAIDEAKGNHAPALEKMNKRELASRAAREIDGTNWLPQPLRPTIPALADDADDVDDLPQAAE